MRGKIFESVAIADFPSSKLFCGSPNWLSSSCFMKCSLSHDSNVERSPKQGTLLRMLSLVERAGREGCQGIWTLAEPGQAMLAEKRLLRGHEPEGANWKVTWEGGAGRQNFALQMYPQGNLQELNSSTSKLKCSSINLIRTNETRCMQSQSRGYALKSVCSFASEGEEPAWASLKRRGNSAK